MKLTTRVVQFYILVYPFNGWVNRRELTSHIRFCIQCVLIQRFKENLTSHRPVVEKRSSTAIRYCGFSSLILDQNSTNSSF